MTASLCIVFHHIEIGKFFFQLAMGLGVVFRREVLNNVATRVAKEFELLARFAVRTRQLHHKDVEIVAQLDRRQASDVGFLPEFDTSRQCVLQHDPIPVGTVTQPSQRIAINLTRWNDPQHEPRTIAIL
ncbi:MAG: hypothetical protein WD070_08195 [Pirellulaceae bacterium]